MRMTPAAIIAGTVLLGGCDAGRPEVVSEDKGAVARAEPEAVPDGASASPVPDDSLSPAPETTETAPPVPAEDQTSTPEPTLFNLPDVRAGDVAENRAGLTAIPARFLGQWDAPEGSCTPESDLFMTIRPGTITFYESQGEVTAVRRGKPGIVVRLAMQGEGDTWTSEYAMSLVRNSERLATREVSTSGTGTIRRRCPPAGNTTGASTNGASANIPAGS